MKNLFFLSLIFLVINASIAQNNVGIGTTNPNPNAILDIHNAGQALGLLLPKVDVTAFTPAANDYGMFVYDTIQNQIFYWNGTTWNGVSPGWTLNGNAGTNPAINFIGTTDLQDLVFRTNNTENMRITSNGKLGVGSSAPANAKVQFFTPSGDAINNTVLQLDNNYSGAGDHFGIINNLSTGTNPKTGVFNVISNATTGARLTGVDSYIIPTGAANQAMGFKAYIDNQGTGSRWALYGDVFSTPTSTGPFTGAQLNMENNSLAGTSYGMLVNTFGTSTNTYGVYTTGELRNYFSGNVGIGATFPSAKLDVVQISTASPSGRFFNGSTPYDDTGFQSSGIALHSASIIGVGAVSTIAALPQLSGNYPSILSFRTAPDGSTPSQERMRILANGRVGIGSFDAVNQLDVAGNMAIGSTYAGTNTAPANSLIVEGSVGIGIPAPAYPLHVFGVNSYGADFGAASIYSNTNNFSNGLVVEGNNTGNNAAGNVYSQAFISGIAPNPTGTNNYGVWGHVPGGGAGGYGILASNGPNRTAPNRYVALAGPTHSGIFIGGNVGIGTASPISQFQILQTDASIGGTSAIRLYFGATYWRTFHSGVHYSFEDDGVRVAYVEGSTGNYVQPSDRALKKNISSVGSVLAGVNQLNPVTYHYNQMKETDKKTIGFIAQEVEQIFPELVKETEDGVKGLSYSDFSILAIKAIQEQQKQIESLQQEIQLLKDSR